MKRHTVSLTAFGLFALLGLLIVTGTVHSLPADALSSAVSTPSGTFWEIVGTLLGSNPFLSGLILIP